MSANLAMFLSFLIISVFAFVSVAVWTAARERERKAFYRNEMLRSWPTETVAQRAVIAFVRQEEDIRTRQRAATNRQAGMILIGVGSALMIGLSQIVRDVPVYLVAGGVPFAVGAMLLLNVAITRKS